MKEDKDYQDISVREMQDIEKKILKTFHTFCENQGLQYYMAYGSLLGTIRHSGFIPWDDDVDVFMPRPDYEQFRAIFNQKRSDQYLFVDTLNRNDWPYIFGKIIDTRTEMEEATYRSGKIGVYIDVFPIDGLPRTALLRKIHMLRINLIHYLLITVQKNNLHGKSPIRVIIKHLLFPVAKIWGIDRILCHLDRLCKKHQYDNSKFVASQTINTYGMREIMPKEWYKNSQKHIFEDMQVIIPQCYDNILKQIYGDYNILPPEDKRLSHHSYRVKLL